MKNEVFIKMEIGTFTFTTDLDSYNKLLDLAHLYSIVFYADSGNELADIKNIEKENDGKNYLEGVIEGANLRRKKLREIVNKHNLNINLIPLYKDIDLQDFH